LPLLGQVPLYPRVLEGGEQGHPIVIAEPESGAARAIDKLAVSLASSLGIVLGDS
jgi:ATP-binding protein involved in chromosome partitioning